MVVGFLSNNKLELERHQTLKRT